MAKTQQETINGWTIYTNRLPMLRGLEQKARVMKVTVPIAAPLAPLAKEAKEGGGIQNIDIERAAVMLAQAAVHLEPAQLPVVIQDILQTTSVVMPDDKGRMNRIDLCDAGAIDRVFTDAGELVLFKVVWFALKVQFENFLGGSVFDLFTQATPTPSP